MSNGDIILKENDKQSCTLLTRFMIVYDESLNLKSVVQKLLLYYLNNILLVFDVIFNVQIIVLKT